VRLRLKLAALAGIPVAIAFVVSVLLADSARATDRITIRGNYYREDSTRVLQPLVTFRKEVLDERLAFEAEYLLDSISSASIGAGAAVIGGDNVFTEIRHESTARVASKLGDWGLSGFFRYSTETDYISRVFGLSGSRDLLQKNVNVSLSYSASLDSVWRIGAFGARAPWRSNGRASSNLTQSHYINAGYAHSLHKSILAGVTMETLFTRGPQENPYRRVLNADNESHPLARDRVAASAWLRWMIEPAKMVVEPRYRFYHGSWGIDAHDVDARLHFRLADQLRLRFRYRYYWQDGAVFWRPDGVYLPDDTYKTADPKLWAQSSHTPGAQITWEFDKIARHKGLKWTRGGWIQATYNHVLRSDLVRQRYGNARVGSLAFSFAF
jgi:hypothetical protein